MSSSTASYAPAVQPFAGCTSTAPSVPVVGASATDAVAGSPPVGTTTMCSPAAPGAWYRTSAVSPVVTSRRSAESSTGGTAGVTSNVVTTPR